MMDEPIDVRITAIEAKLDAVMESQSKVERIAVDMMTQIKPTLDSLMTSPLLKMLGIKKKD